MADVPILIRRGAGVPALANLSTYELGFDTVNDDLYIDNGSAIIYIGGLTLASTYLLLDGSNADQNISIGSHDFATTGLVTTGQIIDNGLTASRLVKTDGSKQLTSTVGTVGIPINITMFDAVPTRASESNWNGGLLLLDTAAAVSNGVPFNITTKGSGKILIVINAGGDMVGDITLTGTSVDRNTGAQTASDTYVITLTGTTTDSSSTDANGNIVHVFTKAYITDKWFTGVVQITTTDTAITDMDIYHISFEQFNDQSNIVINTFDANIYTTNVAAEFDAYLHIIRVTGDECNVLMPTELHVGAVGGAKAQTALANKYFRLRKGGIAESLDGTTDGFWVDVHYANSPVYVEDVTLKVWATQTATVALS